MSWFNAILATLSASLAFFGAITVQARRSAAVRREVERREDQLWGYRDSNGIYHEGVVGTVQELDKLIQEMKHAIDDVRKQDSEQFVKNDEARKDLIRRFEKIEERVQSLE